MLTLELFNRKKYFTKENGDLLVDLTRGSIDKFQFASVNPISVYVVAEEDQMRPDLISHRVYDDHTNVDLLMKYNGISNPFSVEVGDFLRIPSRADIARVFRYPDEIKDIGDISEVNSNRVSQNILNPKTVKDKKRLEELSKNREVVPSNVTKKGDKNVKVKDGKLVFGEDVTAVNKDNCPEPISRARLKRSLTKNNLFG